MLEARRHLRSRTPHVVWQFVVGPNEHQLGDLRRMAAAYGVDEFVVKTAQIEDSRRPSAAHPRSSLAPLRPGSEGRWTLRNPLLDQCWRMWQGAVITWDGRVVPCCFDKDAQHAMGVAEDVEASGTSGPLQPIRPSAGRCSRTGVESTCAATAAKARKCGLDTMKDATPPPSGVRALLLGIGGAVAWMVRDAVVQKEDGHLEGALTVTGWPVALMAVLFFVPIRDLGYVLRLRALSGCDLSWRQAIRNDRRLEFARPSPRVWWVAECIWGSPPRPVGWAEHCRGVFDHPDGPNVLCPHRASLVVVFMKRCDRPVSVQNSMGGLLGQLGAYAAARCAHRLWPVPCAPHHLRRFAGWRPCASCGVGCGP